MREQLRAPCRRLASLPPDTATAAHAQESKVATTPRSVFLMLMKEASGPHWGKLLKAAGKPPHFVKVDWSKYKDEEDEDSELGAPALPPPHRRRRRERNCRRRCVYHGSHA